MREIIVEFGGRYLLWSENSDRPVTTLMTLSELRHFIMLEQGYEGLRELPDRMERVSKYGTSSRIGISKESLLAHNAAGPKETTIRTEQEMVDLYGGTSVAHWRQGEPLDPNKPLELYDYTGFDSVSFVVAEVIGVREGVAFATVQLPGEPENYPVMIRLEDGKVLNEGYKYIMARNIDTPAL